MKDSRTWMVLSLFITCLISAFALSQVYNLTLPQIEYQRNVAGLNPQLRTPASGLPIPEKNGWAQL